jgi:alkylated DNA nucleotide flippase Atl1
VTLVSWQDVKDPSPDFVDRVLAIVKTIPPGRVMTYGDIADALDGHADLAGEAGAYGARLVGQVMARFGDDVAWWRVIRATGDPPKFHEAQAWEHYVEEGTPLTGPRERYRIDLKQARCQAGGESSEQRSLGL